MTNPGSADPRSPALEARPALGDVLGGKSTLESVLGVGGMGAVYAARHAQLGQRVAIKVLLRGAAQRPEAVARFLREARAVVALQSAHVVRVTDVGTLGDGLPFMVMEHLTGTDLAALLEERRELPVEEAVGYLLQAMEAIAEAHAAGLVHRDLKPANLFLTRSPDGSALVKVLDFGISKALESAEADQRPPATAAIMGSPLYMSPEQLRSSKNVDARTDVWALGTILFELVSGRTPFEADSVMGLCTTIAADPPTPLRRYRPEAPKEFESVVMSCLEKDPLKRPQNVGELAIALRPFAAAEARLAVDRIGRIGPPPRSSLRGSDASSPSVGGGVASTTGFAETVATWQTASGVKRRRRTTLVVASVLVVGLAVGGAAWLRASRGVRASNATPSTPSTVAATSPPPPSSASAAPASSVPVAAVTTAAASSATGTAPDAPASASGGRPVPAWLRSSPPAHGTAKPAATPASPAATTAKPAEDLLLDRK